MKYSDMYHMFIFLYLEDGTSIRLDKNDLVDIEIGALPQDHHDCRKKIDLQPKVQLAGMFKIAEKVNKDLYIYIPWKRNCQDFIATLMKALNIKDADLLDWIVQDFEKAFTPAVKLFTKGITDTRALMRRMIGHGKKRKKGPRKPNAWLVHVGLIRAKNPELSYKECLVLAKDSYKK